ncbi:MAG: YdcF family protein [bacterium]|nr:YdcF family protein [bacterium]
MPGGLQQADAIVVLGAAQWSGEPSPVFQARLDHANTLYNANHAPVIIVVGGVGEGETESEAAVGARYLQNRGVPLDALLIEPTGRTTRESLQSVASSMDESGMHTALLVSHDFHGIRLARMAKDIGMSAVVSAVPTKNVLSKARYAMRETVVYAVYILFGI